LLAIFLDTAAALPFFEPAGLLTSLTREGWTGTVLFAPLGRDISALAGLI
jgi:hypothetical protein